VKLLLANKAKANVRMLTNAAGSNFV